MRVGMWPGLSMLPGCFVITAQDIVQHDTFPGQWVGEWEGDERWGELDLSLGGDDWAGSIGVEERWFVSDLDGLRRGNRLELSLQGAFLLDGEDIPYELTMQATLQRIDRVDGDCEWWSALDGQEECVFTLKRVSP